MSHSPERKERDCLNCGTTLYGRYCHICGQENLEPKESVWQLVTHFFNDITHFDGKFFTTLKVLLLRPGFLSKEYMAGRRASYLNPIRMYVFTSAIFFLLFFSFFYSDKGTEVVTTVNGKTIAEINEMDSASFAAFTANINKEDNKPAVPMSRDEFQKYLDRVLVTGIHFTPGTHYRSKAQYDSMLASGAQKHSWIRRQFVYKEIAINERYHNDPVQISKAFQGALIHSIPQMLFISLPFLALILKLLYIRRRQFYYVSHGIFSIHLYIFLFIAMLILFSISRLNDQMHWGILTFISVILSIGLVVYAYLALKHFYRQGWFKTFVKFLLLNLLFLVVLGVLFAVFVLFSLFKI
ncbi:MAG: DUF3667 domain-containing protein [Bacteroidota bacterium]|nr:DUF3667 domain-containing protein [Bacteroidota bacterium]